jgi:hypothetical protein
LKELANEEGGWVVSPKTSQHGERMLETPAGDRSIQYRPEGSKYHFDGRPYIRVSSGKTGIERIDFPK